MKRFTASASALAFVLTGLGWALAPPANASDMGFLQGLSEAGITITNLSNALATGYKVCAALDNGYAPLAVANAALIDIPSLTAYQSGYLVGLAVREICPGHLGQIVSSQTSDSPVAMY